MPKDTPTEKCTGCGVSIGVDHTENCDHARCAATGAQRWCCDYAWYYDEHDNAYKNEHHDCGEDIYDGYYPGVLACQKYDLWCYWGPDYGERGWVVCDKDHPGAREDLNTLYSKYEWSPTQKTWVPYVER